MATTDERQAAHRDMAAALHDAGVKPGGVDGMRFRLHTVDQLSYAQIAAETGCSVHAVEMSISRCRAKLLAGGDAWANGQVMENPTVRASVSVDYAEEFLHCLLDRREVNDPRPETCPLAEYLNVDEVRQVLAGGGGLGIVPRGYQGRQRRRAAETHQEPPRVTQEAYDALAALLEAEREALHGTGKWSIPHREYRERYARYARGLELLREMGQALYTARAAAGRGLG